MCWDDHDEDGDDDDHNDVDDDDDDDLFTIGERMIGNSSYSAHDHAVVHKNFIRLTSDHQHRTGAIWTRRRLCTYYCDV